MTSSSSTEKKTQFSKLEFQNLEKIVPDDEKSFHYSMWISFFSALALTVFFLIISVKAQNLYNLLGLEGTNTERLTSIAYMVASILFFISVFQLNKNKINQSLSTKYLIGQFILWGLFTFFVAGEEESWGMWLFHYQSPEHIAILNTQQELNIHNLKAIDSLLSAHSILNMIALVLGVICPILTTFKITSTLCTKFSIWIPPIYVAPFFFFGFLFEKIASRLSTNWVHVEISEFIYSIGILTIGIGAFLHSRKFTKDQLIPKM